MKTTPAPDLMAAHFVDLSTGKLVNLARVHALFMNEIGR